ncbi:MAG: hypothetical protein MUP80_17195, partial [Acidobacteriia bacterium]|nr:hypothetical protein [Terriglobia bacterium]
MAPRITGVGSIWAGAAAGAASPPVGVGAGGLGGVDISLLLRCLRRGEGGACASPSPLRRRLDKFFSDG